MCSFWWNVVVDVQVDVMFVGNVFLYVFGCYWFVLYVFIYVSDLYFFVGGVFLGGYYDVEENFFWMLEVICVVYLYLVVIVIMGDFVDLGELDVYCWFCVVVELVVEEFGVLVVWVVGNYDECLVLCVELWDLVLMEEFVIGVWDFDGF